MTAALIPPGDPGAEHDVTWVTIGRMTDLPTAGDSGWSDPDTLGAIPPVVAVTYCASCGRSANKGNHVLCRERLRVEPPVHCTTCRRELAIVRSGSQWSATCKKHGETSGTLEDA